MPAWYDIEHMDINRTIDVRGIAQSADRVDAIIQAQIDVGIDPNRIILVGFSQGGAVALYAGVRSKEPLAGVLALSTYWVGDQDSTLSPVEIQTLYRSKFTTGRLIPWSLMYLESKHVTRCLRLVIRSRFRRLPCRIAWCLNNFGPSDNGWHYV